MLERLIVHIGPPKTGSKSIQHGLHHNRQYFADRGLIYPAGRWHGQLSSWVLDGDPNSDYNVVEKRPNQTENAKRDEQYVAELRAELTNNAYRYGILSYEGFAGMSNSAWGKVKNFLSDCAREISILVYCRHPQSLGPSILGGCAAAGVICHPIDMVRHYKSILKPIVKVFGKENVILREFANGTLYRGDLLLDAVAQLDKDLSDDAYERGLGGESHNRGLSYEAFQIAQHLLPQLNISTNGTNRLRYFRCLSTIKGGKLQLSKRQADDVTRFASGHIKYLKSTFGFEFTQPEEVEYRKPEAGLSPETAESIAAALAFAIEQKSPTDIQ